MTMTIETELDSGSAIIQSLERRFSVLEQSKGTYNFSDAERDYIDYLEGEKGFHPALKVLATDNRYYDVMTRIIFVLNMPSGKPYNIVEGSLDTINVPIFLKESQFKKMSFETIKSEELKRRKITRDAVINETAGSGSRERAHAIATDVEHQRWLSPLRKLHLAILSQLSDEDKSITRTTPDRSPKSKLHTIRLDNDRKILFVGDNHINLSHAPIQRELLSTILGDPAKIHDEWFFAEMDPVSTILDENNRIKLKNAAYAFQRTLQRRGIEDFFQKLDTKSCKINNQYTILIVA